MTHQYLLGALTALILSGCDRHPAPAPEVANASALPLIQEAIARQVPEFDGRWSASIMGQVCQLAAGKLDKAGFAQWFGLHGVDVVALAASDAGFRFIAGIDAAKATVACAAWQVSALLDPVTASGGAIGDSQALSRQLTPLTPQVDSSIALLTRIAAQSGAGRYASQQAYRQAVTAMLVGLAPGYVDATVKHAPVSEDLRRPGSSHSRFDYRLVNGQTHVIYNGVLWLGDGQLMGQTWRVALDTRPSH